MEAQVLLGGQVAVKGRVLEDQPDVPAYVVALGPYVETGHGGRPGVRRRQRAQDLDRRRLAGAVRPEEAEGLADEHVEVDAPDRLDLAVRLAQPTDLDRRHTSPLHYPEPRQELGEGSRSEPGSTSPSSGATDAGPYVEITPGHA